MKINKLLLLVLCAAILMSSIAPFAVFAENSRNILFSDDFQGSASAIVGGMCSVVTDADGSNRYLEFSHTTASNHSGTNPGSSGQVRIAKLPQNFALTTDIYQEADNTENFYFEYFTDDEDGNGEADSYGNMVISKTDVPVGKWHTLSARKVNGSGTGSVFVVSLTDKTTGESKNISPTYAPNVSGRATFNRFMLRSKNVAGSVMHWRIDNITVEENFDFQLPNRYVEVDTTYEGEKFMAKGLLWTPVDNVKGTVDDKSTSDKSDDEYAGAVVTPTAYINGSGNVLATTSERFKLETSRPYGVYLYSADNDGTEVDASRFTDNHDFETRIKFDDYFYIMYYTGTHRFYLLFNSSSAITYNDKNNEGYSIEADMGYNRWIDLKLSVRNRKWGTIYINGREIVTYELPVAPKAKPYVQYAVYKDDCVTNLEIASAKVTPKDNDSLRITSVSHNGRFRAGGNVLLTSNMTGSGKLVSYIVNGVNVGTDSGSGLTLSDIKAGVYDISAECDGVRTEPIRIFADSENNDENEEICSNGEGEYIVEYDYDGASEGNVLINDGYFTLDFTHNGNVIVYRGLNGKKKYTGIQNGIGAGRYKAVVTSGYAEVYFNNQFVFSTFLPYTYNESPDAEFTYINLENVTKNPSGVKKERYRVEWNGREELAEYGMDFGQLYSAEFDKLDTSDETIVIYNGEYQAKLTFDQRGITAETQKESYGKTESYCLTDEVKTGYYRVTVAYGLAQLFRNNEFIGSFKCPVVNHCDAVFRKLENPDGSTFVAIKDTDDIYFHSEDFEGRGELDALDYWFSEFEGMKVAEGRDDPFVQEVISEDGNRCLKITDKGLGSYVTPVTENDAEPIGDFNLNVSADNPVFRWRAKADGKGAVHFIGRHIQRGVFLSFGYDFEKNQWILSKHDRMGNSAPYYDGETILDSTGGSLDTNWHDYELVMNEGDASLFCDGVRVLNCSGLENSHGRVGFGVSKGASLLIDDVEYSGEGKVSPGVSYISEYNMGSKDFFYSPHYGGVIAASTGKNNYLTKDKGRTWEAVSASFGNTSLNLLSGGFMHVGYGSSGWNLKRTYSAYYPQKACEFWGDLTRMINGSWGQESLLVEPDWFDDTDYGRSIMPGRLVQVQDGKYKGRIFYSRDAGVGETYGKPLLFYTDADVFYDPENTAYYDGTRNKKAGDVFYPVVWTQSQTSFYYDETGINGQEPLTVDMPDDVIRYFIRNDCGFLHYADSYDGGDTFGEFKPSQLLAPLCCYGIMRDPQNLDHYYAYYQYDANTTDKDKNGGRPRTRGALAVSYDGMKNWHHLMDVEELTDDWKTSYTPMNHGMRVIDGVVYMSYMTNKGYSKIFTVDLSKAKPMLRFSEVHEKKNYYVNVPDEVFDEHCVLPKESGEGSIFGEVTEVDAEDGAYDAETIEKVFGMTQKVMGKFDFFGVEIEATPNEEGKYSLNEVAKVFSKNIMETPKAYIISNSEVSRLNGFQFENMGVRKSFDEELRANFLNSINVSSEYGFADEFRRHIEENRKFLNLPTVELSDELIQKLMTREYYSAEDFESALASAVKAEDGKTQKLLVSTVGKAFDGWSKLSSENALTTEMRDGELHIEANGYFGSGGAFGITDFNVPDDETYVLTFDVTPVKDSEFRLTLGGKAHSLGFDFETGETGATDEKITLLPDVRTNVKMIVSKAQGGRIAEITLTPQGETAKSFSVHQEDGEPQRGLVIDFGEETRSKIALENVRVYWGKALDITAYSVSNEKISASAQFLNDGAETVKCQLFIGIYKNGKAEKFVTVSGNEEIVAEGFGAIDYELKNVEFQSREEDEIELRFFLWNPYDGLAPMTEDASVSR